MILSDVPQETNSHQEDRSHRTLNKTLLEYVNYCNTDTQKLNFVYIFQENDGQKTNNGIHYRLQLLYANGKLTGEERFSKPNLYNLVNLQI